jgi:hypothetical protein
MPAAVAAGRYYHVDVIVMYIRSIKVALILSKLGRVMKIVTLSIIILVQFKYTT